MNKHKRNLIILLLIQTIITIIHIALDRPSKDMENWIHEAGWHYWLGLTFGSGIIIYAFSLRCKSCGAGQVIRNMSIFSLRWPQDECWKCGNEI